MPDAFPNLELTTQQKKALAFCISYIDQHGVMPSLSVLGAHLDVYPNAARHHVRVLRERGYLKEKKVTATRLTVSSKGRRAL